MKSVIIYVIFLITMSFNCFSFSSNVIYSSTDPLSIKYTIRSDYKVLEFISFLKNFEQYEDLYKKSILLGDFKKANFQIKIKGWNSKMRIQVVKNKNNNLFLYKRITIQEGHFFKMLKEGIDNFNIHTDKVYQSPDGNISNNRAQYAFDVLRKVFASTYYFSPSEKLFFIKVPFESEIENGKIKTFQSGKNLTRKKLLNGLIDIYRLQEASILYTDLHINNLAYSTGHVIDSESSCYLTSVSDFETIGPLNLIVLPAFFKILFLNANNVYSHLIEEKVPSNIKYKPDFDLMKNQDDWYLPRLINRFHVVQAAMLIYLNKNKLNFGKYINEKLISKYALDILEEDTCQPFKFLRDEKALTLKDFIDKIKKIDI